MYEFARAKRSACPNWPSELRPPVNSRPSSVTVRYSKTSKLKCKSTTKQASYSSPCCRPNDPSLVGRPQPHAAHARQAAAALDSAWGRARCGVVARWRSTATTRWMSDVCCSTTTRSLERMDSVWRRAMPLSGAWCGRDGGWSRGPTNAGRWWWLCCAQQPHVPMTTMTMISICIEWYRCDLPFPLVAIHQRTQTRATHATTKYVAHAYHTHMINITQYIIQTNWILVATHHWCCAPVNLASTMLAFSFGTDIGVRSCTAAAVSFACNNCDSLRLFATPRARATVFQT